ncbi:elongation of very long chain fatty acids protein 7-like isoform X2 [Sitodiplosis mosellana]|uniref:elongation of very long chain fatty acids protein 7-like isoform X2 n=1 Tax=Sitodiplosis mosellana TaxID=263140 RepID=UPI0024447832|nr:elongation of very long chain fatty acids protein 7-like isoform X2 [Sitodiplosis mosellana]
MLVLRYLVQHIDTAMKSRDARLQSLPCMSVEFIITIVTLYLLFVLKWGPKFMEKRKPFNIERILLFYNVFQVLCNFSIVFYVTYEIFALKSYKLDFFCEELDFTDSFVGTRSAQMSYCYYLIKLMDLFDTIFFVLRKRTRQISFLHVYHHVAILLASFVGVSWFPGGHPWLFGMLNCFVHVIMYGYYFGSVYSPKLKVNLTIKRSITQMQIIQFMLSIVHLSMPFFVSDCGYPKSVLIIGISQNAIMMMLFSDFYYKTYMKAPKLKSS